MLIKLKARVIMPARMIITVMAGLIPNQADAKYSMRYVYTTEDYESDIKLPPHHQKMGFLLAEAYEYARALPIPHALNWVTLEQVWL